jgi:hypothetical protein
MNAVDNWQPDAQMTLADEAVSWRRPFNIARDGLRRRSVCDLIAVAVAWRHSK